MKNYVVGLGLTAALVVPALAGATTVSGSFDGSSWTASNNIVGVTSTATSAPPTPPGTAGNPIYWGHSPAPGFNNKKYSGVVALILDEGAAGRFICSGSLLSDRVSIVTAGHCISSGHGAITPISTTAYFYGGTDPQAVVSNPATPGVVGVGVAAYHVNPLYTGEVIDDHDIAVLTLATKAPAFATSYSLYSAGDLTRSDYNIAGYGQRSDQGGNVGANLGTGRLRQGDNRYDFALGNPAFGGFFDGKPTGGFFGKAETGYSFISDFDNGLAANDASCKLGSAFGTAQFCNLGRGPTEVSSAGGDSGGPQFVNGRIASVTSYGLSFGRNFGDIDGKLNSSFGEFNGFVSTTYNRGFIDSVASVPEPAAWAMMVVGFGLVGAMVRRGSRTAMIA
jgi:hypothetical protein